MLFGLGQNNENTSSPFNQAQGMPLSLTKSRIW